MADDGGGFARAGRPESPDTRGIFYEGGGEEEVGCEADAEVDAVCVGGWILVAGGQGAHGDAIVVPREDKGAALGDGVVGGGFCEAVELGEEFF